MNNKTFPYWTVSISMQWTCNVRIEWKGKKCMLLFKHNIHVRVWLCCVHVCLSFSLLFFAWIHFCAIALSPAFFRFACGTAAHSIHFSLNIITLWECDIHTYCCRCECSNKWFDLFVVCVFQQKPNDKHTNIHVAHFTH